MFIRSAMGVPFGVSLMATAAAAHNVGCLAGDAVTATWSGDGHRHEATILSINLDDTITVKFDSKTKGWEQVPWEGVLVEEEVCTRPQLCSVGDKVKAKAVPGKHDGPDDDQERWGATILSISSDGTITVKWSDPDPDQSKTASMSWDRVEKNHIVCYVPPPVTPAPAPAPAPPGSISSAESGKCLAAPYPPKSGDYLFLWDCDGGAEQKWAWQDYKLYWDGGPVWTMCVDVPFGDTTNGNQLWVWECSGLPQQQWSWYEDTSAIFLGEAGASKCMDLRNGNSDNGAALQIWDCTNFDTMNQMWKYTASSETQVI